LKPSRYKKLLGLAVGERSMLIAEVAGAGDRPDVRQLAELTYPAGVSLDHPAELGKALAALLREKRIGTSDAVVGLPARWMVAAAKEVPAAAADLETRASILRLEAEAEFSTELKDLVFDFVDTDRGRAVNGSPAAQTVLLMATSRKYVDAAVAMCRGAKLNLVSVCPSAVALGQATSRGMPEADDSLVLFVGASGAELTAHRDASPSALRHLRAASSQPAFVSELRRAVSTLPRSRGTAQRELVLWDGAGIDADALGSQIGVSVRQGDLPALGVNASTANRNGAGRAFAAAVALTLPGVRGEGMPIDFLHSRLAAPKARRIPRWAYLAVIAVVACVGLGIYAYTDLQNQQAELDNLNTRLTALKPQIQTAEAFVSRVSFAQGWHNGEPRYLACLRDLTSAIPDDGQTYATSLIVREAPKETTNARSAAVSPAAAAAKRTEARVISGQLYGKTSDQQHVQFVLDHMKQIGAFRNVKLGGTQDAGRGREVSFSITFDYLPGK